MNTATQINDDFLLRAIEVEQKLSLHRVTLLRLAEKNKAPKPIKIGGRWLWRNSEIELLMAGKWVAQ